MCRHSEGSLHDCAYVERRNGFIADAAKHADSVAGRSSAEWLSASRHPVSIADSVESDYAWRLMWDRAFLTKMDELMGANP